MTQSGENTLLTLLSGGGRTLINFKFLPGENPSSPEALCATAYSWLNGAIDGELSMDIPKCAREQRSIGDVIASF